MLSLATAATASAAVSPPGPITAIVVAAALALALLCSAIAYLLYYRLIANAGPTRALTVTFLIPAFAMAWGALFLGETITLAMLIGCALIVGGTASVLRPQRAGRSPASTGTAAVVGAARARRSPPSV